MNTINVSSFYSKPYARILVFDITYVFSYLTCYSEYANTDVVFFCPLKGDNVKHTNSVTIGKQF